MINSFRVNVDANDVDHTSYLNEGGIEIDTGQGEKNTIYRMVEEQKNIRLRAKKTDRP